MPNATFLCCAVTPSGASCGTPPLPDLPVLLCGTHLRMAYEAAQDLVNEGWSDALSAYVRTLHDELADERRALAHERRTAAGVARKSSNLDTPGMVYFVRFSDRIKIGFTANLQARLRDIPHDEVLMVVPGSRKEERRFHEKFAHLRETGEWFRATSELMAFIERIPPNSVSRKHGIR